MILGKLKDYAAKFKWDFQPDDLHDNSGGVVKFPNVFLRQRSEGFIVGRLYHLEVPLTECLALEEIAAISRLHFGAYLVPQVGRLNATFTLARQDETLIYALRKLLEWRP